MKITQSIIHLGAMSFYAYHGVLLQERTVGAYYQVSLSIEPSHIETAVLHDRLEGTINYAEVYCLVAEEMAKPSELLEHVAGRILQRLFATQPLAQKATLVIAKQSPPMVGADMKSAAIELTAER